MAVHFTLSNSIKMECNILHRLLEHYMLRLCRPHRVLMTYYAARAIGTSSAGGISQIAWVRASEGRKWVKCRNRPSLEKDNSTRFWWKVRHIGTGNNIQYVLRWYHFISSDDAEEPLYLMSLVFITCLWHKAKTLAGKWKPSPDGLSKGVELLFGRAAWESHTVNWPVSSTVQLLTKFYYYRRTRLPLFW